MKRQRMAAGDFETKMDMTPLIDCVFLLIMFFILTTEITVQLEQVELPFALEGKQQEEGQSDVMVVLNIRLKDEKKRTGEIIYNGETHNLESLGKMLSLEALRDEEIRGRKREQSPGGQKLSQLEVLVRADRNVHSSYLRTVFEACSKAGIYKIKISSVPPSES